MIATPLSPLEIFLHKKEERIFFFFRPSSRCEKNLHSDPFLR